MQVKSHRGRTSRSAIKAASAGQASAEFAMTAILYLTVIFGIIDYGRVLYAYNSVAYSAREASRYASVRGSTSKSPATASNVTTIVQNNIVGLSTSNNELAVTTSWSPNNKPGSTVQVKVVYTMSHLIPFWTSISLPLTSTSKMVISQ